MRFGLIGGIVGNREESWAVKPKQCMLAIDLYEVVTKTLSLALAGQTGLVFKYQRKEALLISSSKVASSNVLSQKTLEPYDSKTAKISKMLTPINVAVGSVREVRRVISSTLTLTPIQNNCRVDSIELSDRDTLGIAHVLPLWLWFLKQTGEVGVIMANDRSDLGSLGGCT